MSKDFFKNRSMAWPMLSFILVVFLIIMKVIFRITAPVLLRFIILNIVSIFLPGIALYRMSKLELSAIGQFSMSYILGYAFIILEFFLSELTNRVVSFKVITCCFACLSFIYIVLHSKKRNIPKSKHNNDAEKIDLFFLTLSILLCISAYSLTYLGPDVAPVFTAHRDMQYWVNNTISLKIGWPADNLFMSGTPLNYHYFSNIPIAFLCEAYDIDVFSMSFPLYSLTKAILMFGSVQSFFECINAKKNTRFLGYIIILFTTGAENVIVVTFTHHILISPFGFDIGFFYGFIFICFLLLQWQQDYFCQNHFLGLILSWIMCVGAKAPVAAVFILFAALLCFYWLVNKKYALAFGYGLPILLTFLVICKYCVGMFSVLEGESTWSLSLHDYDEITSFFTSAEDWDFVANLLISLGQKFPFLAIPIQFLMVNPAMAVYSSVSLCSVLYTFITKHNNSKEFYLCFSLVLTALFGLILGVLINAGGYSEMYFSMAAQVPMAFLIVLFFPAYKRKHNFFRLLYAIFLIPLLIGVFRFSYSSWAGDGAIIQSRTNWQNYCHISNIDFSKSVNQGIRHSDAEALSWLRKNATTDALIMSDKAILSDSPRYYLYGIFSERQQYLEGIDMLDFNQTNLALQHEIARRKDIILSVYNNQERSVLQAKNEGIKYIVQTKDISPNFTGNNPLLELVTETETIRIYQIK